MDKVSIHESLMADFERGVLCGRAKLTEHERLIFRAGMFFTDIWKSKVATNEPDHQKLVEQMVSLAQENEAFGENELARYHIFFCEGCDHFQNGGEKKYEHG